MRFTKNDQMLLGSVYQVGVLKESTEGKGQPLPPEAQKALTDWIKAIATKAVDGDQEAIKLLSDPKALQQYFQEMVKAAEQQQGGQQPVTEAFEKMRANIGAKLHGGDPIEKRYNLFLSDINGHLWEISQDSRFLNVDPQNVKDFISTISSIEPQVKQQSKLLQNIGYGIGKTLGRTAFVIPIVAGLMYAAPLVGLGGISTIAFQAIAGAFGGAGALAKILNNKQMTKYEKVMEVVATAVKAATLAGLFVPDTGGPYTGEGENIPKPTDPDDDDIIDPDDDEPIIPKRPELDPQKPVIPSGRDLPEPDWGDDIKGPDFPKSDTGLDSEFGKSGFEFPDDTNIGELNKSSIIDDWKEFTNHEYGKMSTSATEPDLAHTGRDKKFLDWMLNKLGDNKYDDLSFREKESLFNNWKKLLRAGRI